VAVGAGTMGEVVAVGVDGIGSFVMAGGYINAALALWKTTWLVVNL